MGNSLPLLHMPLARVAPRLCWESVEALLTCLAVGWDLSEAVSRTPTVWPLHVAWAFSQCCSWVPRMRFSLRDSHVSHIRGKMPDLYDLALEMMAT